MIHHYRVFGRSAAHASLCGTYMAKLWSFTVWQESEARWEFGRLTNKAQPRRNQLHSAVSDHGVRTTILWLPRLVGRCPRPDREYQWALHLRRPFCRSLHLSGRPNLRIFQRGGGGSRSFTVGGLLYCQCYCCFRSSLAGTLCRLLSACRGRHSGLSIFPGVTHFHNLC